MKSFLIAFFTLWICVRVDASPEIPGWRLVWSDEFDGDTLDDSKWKAEDAALEKNNEAQTYSPDEVFVGDGVLTLRSQKRQKSGRDYTSGLVETIGRFSQTYGRFEVRAKLPRGQGIWPAHWLMPADNSWPPEIDIMEMLGHDPRKIYMSNHWSTPQGARNNTANYTGPDFSEDFHVFAVEWDPETIRWFVDGTLRHSSSKNVPDVPMRVILNTAVGGNWPKYPDATTVFPQIHLIDYVRVYAKDHVQFIDEP